MCALTSLLGRVRTWAAEAAARRRVAQEFAILESHETDRVLADIGCSRADLPALINNVASSGNLLRRMTARIGLRAVFAASDLTAVREIERRCTTCTSARRCRRWLDGEGGADVPARFCPNAGNFAALKEAAIRAVP